ncbi:MAG: DUF177 domain-containing protein [Bdellovibrionota bacterium]|nr:DUF177 domain-containing protein [Bdellovibrionota bacterium]
MLNEIERKIKDEISDNPVFLISRLKDKEDIVLTFDQSSPWVSTILSSITAEYEPEEIIEPILNVEITLKRDSNNTFGEYLVAHGSVTGQYMASCVKCLDDAKQEFSSEFTGAYVHSRYENDPEYEEVDEIYIDEKVCDLYFHDRGKSNLSELITEATVLAINPYPSCKSECKGLCGQCGENKNHVDCGHH